MYILFGFRYYHIQLCERWGTEWFLNVKVTRRNPGCPLRLNQTNFNRATNQNVTGFDFRSTRGANTTSTSGNSPGNNNRINVNLISQTTCNINIHVTSQDGNTTGDSTSGAQQQRQQQQQQQQQQQSGNGCQNNTDNAGNSSSRNYGIFSTMSSSYPLIQTNHSSPRPPNSTPFRLSPSHTLPAFGIPPPSFESVTSSQGADPAFFRQSSISSHSHSPPPSFENSFMFDPLPSVDGASPGFLDIPTVLPDYESLHHGPPPSYESVFPS